MRIKQFSDRDSDGIGGVVLSKHAFYNVDYELRSMENINHHVKSFLEMYIDSKNDMGNYDYVVITDLSVNDEVAELIDYANENISTTKFLLLDHHKSAVWLNRYSWANVQITVPEKGEEIKTCGTHLWFRKISELGLIRNPTLYEKMRRFAEVVRQWDTFDWIRIDGGYKANQLNTLVEIHGLEKMIDRFTKNLDLRWSEDERFLLSVEETRIDRYVEEKKQQFEVITTGSGLRVGVVFAEKYTSIVGNKICRDNPSIDFVAIMTPSIGRVSFRTTREDLDLGMLAKEKLLGGGHPKSAGCPIGSLLELKYLFEKI